ncbi:hypothetical protein Nepgr_016228 [Nepenthes gracilis]|uniref:Uncharacterized protein n=1 Tax=Nepenthes gracilis TaxID=150966 RepID=A0AAD3SPV6_NEPGR|nr:hypothetical protein Nepgr_016228 [Nepenthes gracilis]
MEPLKRAGYQRETEEPLKGGLGAAPVPSVLADFSRGGERVNPTRMLAEISAVEREWRAGRWPRGTGPLRRTRRRRMRGVRERNVGGEVEGPSGSIGIQRSRGAPRADAALFGFPSPYQSLLLRLGCSF